MNTMTLFLLFQIWELLDKELDWPDTDSAPPPLHLYRNALPAGEMEFVEDDGDNVNCEWRPRKLLPKYHPR